MTRRRQPDTRRHDAAALYVSGRSIQSIADEYGRAYSTVYEWLAAAGVQFRRRTSRGRTP